MVLTIRETTMTNRLGNYRYDGHGQILETDEEYTIFDTEDGEIEAYPKGQGDAIILPNRGAFESLRCGRLEKVEGATPMR